jgi:hypothetical protein
MYACMYTCMYGTPYRSNLYIPQSKEGSYTETIYTTPGKFWQKLALWMCMCMYYEVSIHGNAHSGSISYMRA